MMEGNLEISLEQLRAKLLEEFGEFAKGISLEHQPNPEQNSVTIRATFMIGAQSTLSNNAFSSSRFDILETTIMHLVHDIERTLYDMLPIYGTEPQIAGVKIRVDSHLPKGVIWMHPEVYANIMQNPELRRLLIFQPQIR